MSVRTFWQVAAPWLLPGTAALIDALNAATIPAPAYITACAVAATATVAALVHRHAAAVDHRAEALTRAFERGYQLAREHCDHVHPDTTVELPQVVGGVAPRRPRTHLRRA